MIYEMYVVKGPVLELEGVFSSKKEMAAYLETSITTIEDIIECNMDDLRRKFHDFMIIRRYEDGEEYQDNVNSETTQYPEDEDFFVNGEKWEAS